MESVCEHLRYLRRIDGIPSNALRAECRKLADEFGCDVDFSDAIFAEIDAAPDSDAEDESANGVRYWIYAPGAQAAYWDENLRDGLMGLGWNEVGDVRAFESKKELRLKLVSTNPDSNSDQSNAANTLWKFANVMRPGDVVYAKKGAKKIIGRGVVRSDYRFDAADSTTSHLRQIDWTPGEVDVPPSNRYFVTLQDVTKYFDVVRLFEDAFEIAPTEPTRTICEPYSADDFLSEVFLDKERYDDLVGVLRRKKNVVIQGAPGVGKSFCANRLAWSMMGEKDVSRVATIQFHQSYGYEDFIAGYRPTETGFELKRGPFYEFCKKAESDDEREYFFIIDELNRGNASRIFGELLTIIENDKRGKALRMLYSNELFSVPRNVYLIGLTNTADRSLAALDYALRRRFSFFNFEPAFDVDAFKTYRENLGLPALDALISQIVKLNEEISQAPALGNGCQIGHSYFCNLDRDDVDEGEARKRLNDVVEYDVLPTLKEYWFDEPERWERWAGALRAAVRVG